MIISKLINVNLAARRLNIDSHRIAKFRNGQTKALTENEINALAELIEEELKATLAILKPDEETIN